MRALSLSFGLLATLAFSNGAASASTGDTTPGGRFDGCIHTFSDHRTYGWTSFRNDCASPLELVACNKKTRTCATYDRIDAGRAVNTGDDPGDAPLGYSMFMCPVNQVPVTTEGAFVGTLPAAEAGQDIPYRCKIQ